MEQTTKQQLDNLLNIVEEENGKPVSDTFRILFDYLDTLVSILETYKTKIQKLDEKTNKTN